MKKLCFIAQTNFEAQIIRTCLDVGDFETVMENYNHPSSAPSTINTILYSHDVIPIGVINVYATNKEVAADNKSIYHFLARTRIFCFDNCLSALFPSELRDDEYCFRDDKRDDIIAYLKEHIDDFKKNEVIVEIQDYINELIKRYNEEE